MSSDEVVISVKNLDKYYQIYERPSDRLKQFVMPRLERWIGKPGRNHFREFKALHDISFEIRRGETVGIIGRNGSGKSTLLQLICGTLSPTNGVVETHGRIAALLELGSGFNPEFSGRENVYMNATVLGLTAEEVSARFDSIVAFADIGDFIDQPVKTYSSGMAVRLAFAVIAHVDADILIIDEALSVGDAFFVQKCMRFLREFMESGTVLFVSHDTGSVINLCQSAIWLDKGGIKCQGSPKSVAEKYLAALYETPHGERGAEARQPEATEITTQSTEPARDMRLDFINVTQYRNDIELKSFEEGNESFGQGGAIITAVQFLDDQGRPLSWVVGGENVRINIHCRSRVYLKSPIVGFLVKDRLGQHLFGDNTYLTYVDHPIHIDEDQEFSASFEFRMPVLPIGDYSVAAAIAEGTQEGHIQHHWIHDALMLKSHSSSVSTGLVGVPMKNIEMITV